MKGWFVAIAVTRELELRVGDSDRDSSSSSFRVGRREGVTRPRGVQLLEAEGGVEALWSLEGEVWGVCCCGGLVGDVGVGVKGWLTGKGEEGESGRRKGEAGDSGRLKGEVRGEP